MKILYFLLPIAGVYFLSLPEFIQGGDTAELVAAGYQRLVAHPPGYPIWIWLQYVWTHLLQFGSIFWRASLLNSVFALVTLGILGWPHRKDPVKLALLLPLVGFATAFSEAAVLPDVFSL